MYKVAEFIYPWGGGHYSRMMSLDFELRAMRNDIEYHYATKSPIIERVRDKFPNNHSHIHEILMPTPIGGSTGPSVSRSLINFFLPIGGKPLPYRIATYLRAEGHLYDREKFDLVINDGDMGSNVISSSRSVPSLFVTNQYKPRLYDTRFYLRPAAVFIAKQIAKATRILVADSEPPNCICEYNLNIPKDVMHKVEFVGHFANIQQQKSLQPPTKLESLIDDAEFGYWMRTGDMPTNNATGAKYEDAFSDRLMRDSRRIVSHAKKDESINRVIDREGKSWTISEAYSRGVDWLQIDVGFLTESERNTVLDKCKYAVVNGSHTVLGEIIGIKAKPIIGVPIYDEHVNQIQWAQEHGLGVLARRSKEIAQNASSMFDAPGQFSGALTKFANAFKSGGAKTSAQIASDMLEQ